MTFDNRNDSAPLRADSGSNSVRIVTEEKKSTHAYVDADVETSQPNRSPPDGGFRAYLVMFCGFLCNGILFGIINTYSVIYLSIYNKLKEQGDELASSKAGEHLKGFTT
jgi:hypothetical protein